MTPTPIETIRQTFSDYHKDLYGCRPRHVDHSDDVALRTAWDAAVMFHQQMLSTPAGRERLRSDGWCIPEEESASPKKAGA